MSIVTASQRTAAPPAVVSRRSFRFFRLLATELRLVLREPIVLIFVFAFPALTVLILGALPFVTVVRRAIAVGKTVLGDDVVAQVGMVRVHPGVQHGDGDARARQPVCLVQLVSAQRRHALPQMPAAFAVQGYCLYLGVAGEDGKPPGVEGARQSGQRLVAPQQAKILCR